MPEQLTGSLPRRASIEPTEQTTVLLTSGTVLNDLVDPSTLKNIMFYHNAPAVAGSIFSWSFQLMAGTYNFNIICLANYPTAGIMQFDVDGVTIATIDPFLLLTVYNTLVTTTGVVIPTSGAHQLRLICPGKNILASGFELWLDAIWFNPASD